MQTITFPLTASAIAIILNGQREAIAHLCSHWQDYQLIIICDGAWATLEQEFLSLIQSQEFQSQEFQSQELNLSKKGNSPQLIVLGDGDSLVNKPPHFIQYDDQYSTDFEKALRHALGLYKCGSANLAIDIYWANGGELDHTMGNMAMACKYHQQITCHFFTDSQYYRYFNPDVGIVNIKGAMGKKLSLFPFPQCIVKRSAGIRYPMTDYQMTQHTQQSLRNEINEELAMLEFGKSMEKQSKTEKGNAESTEEKRVETGCFVFVEL